ncbi:MAG TPA: hypothetical protein VIH93_01535, partial [Thermoanaerobaculia bacterium]
MSRAPSKVSAPSLELAGGPWAELAALCRDGGENDRPFRERLLETWCAASGAGAAALYLERAAGEDALDLDLAWGGGDFPEELDHAALPAGVFLLSLGPGALAVRSWEAENSASAAWASSAAASPFLPLLVLAARDGQHRRRLKEQSFQVNFRGVELE